MSNLKSATPRKITHHKYCVRTIRWFKALHWRQTNARPWRKRCDLCSRICLLFTWPWQGLMSIIIPGADGLPKIKKSLIGFCVSPGIICDPSPTLRITLVLTLMWPYFCWSIFCTIYLATGHNLRISWSHGDCHDLKYVVTLSECYRPRAVKYTKYLCKFTKPRASSRSSYRYNKIPNKHLKRWTT